MKFRSIIDGWKNVFTKSGTSGDKTEHTVIESIGQLSQYVLDSLYETGMGGKVVNAYVEDMTRAGYIIKNDRDNHLKNKFKMLNINKYSTEALRWNYVHGGSLIFYLIADGSNDPIEPLNEGSIKTVDSMKFFERFEVSVKEWYTEYSDDKFDQPKTYTISPVNGSSFDVHESRTYRFTGLDISKKNRKNRDCWGQSLLERVYYELRFLGAANKSVEAILDDFIVSVFSIPGLADKLQGDAKAVNDYINILDMSRHVLNAYVIDEGQIFEKKSSSVSGMPDLLKQRERQLSAVSDIPATRLMGKSPDGQNSTGTSDLELWYNKIQYLQENEFEPFLMHTANMIMLSSESPFSGIDEDVNIEFNELWQATNKEKSETRKNNSEAYKNMVETGSMTTEEVRETAKEEYSLDENANINNNIPTE